MTKLFLDTTDLDQIDELRVTINFLIEDARKTKDLAVRAGLNTFIASLKTRLELALEQKKQLTWIGDDAKNFHHNTELKAGVVIATRLVENGWTPPKVFDLVEGEDDDEDEFD